MCNLDELSLPQLLALHAEVLRALRGKGVIRSSNNPVGDLAEYLFCHAFGWKRVPNSQRDYDAKDATGTRFQIKGRRLTEHNESRQLGALRDIPGRHFDVLAAVLFDEDFRVIRAALIPHDRVQNLAVFQKRTNSWRFLLHDKVWLAPGVTDVTVALR